MFPGPPLQNLELLQIAQILLICPNLLRILNKKPTQSQDYNFDETLPAFPEPEYAPPPDEVFHFKTVFKA